MIELCKLLVNLLLNHLITQMHPEVPDSLLEALRSASINEEHRTIMSAVIQKVQSAKSGLTKACASLLTGFQVSV